ncbi:DUF6702 family protein [Sediminitomix flava]|uniref:Peptidase E n=1 Tax=Sediminitomix flava TaxID=379075 RepID=A0A315ZZP2_SEDFL|nr:DUF6702 family protein [Sediminitomix flava]PWJ42847.1 hypothetical protein BC781_102393 [Sediminitomix flava]
MTFWNKTSITFSILLTLCGIALAHPLHLSLTEMQYDQDSKALQITHKIFIDDLEDAIEKKYNLRLRLHTEKEHAESEKYVRLYIEENFTGQINNKEINFQWIGMETDMESLWAYREVSKVKKINTVIIQNTILSELFDDQKNMVHIFYKEIKRTLLFDREEKTQEIEMK